MKEVIHVIELEVLWHLRIGGGKQPERIQPAGSNIADLCPRRHANPKEQLIDLDAELEAGASLVSLRSNESVPVYRREHLRQGCRNS